MNQAEMAWLTVGVGVGLLFAVLVASPTLRLIAGTAGLIAGLVALSRASKVPSKEGRTHV